MRRNNQVLTTTGEGVYTRHMAKNTTVNGSSYQLRSERAQAEFDRFIGEVAKHRQTISVQVNFTIWDVIERKVRRVPSQGLSVQVRPGKFGEFQKKMQEAADRF